MTEPEPVSPSQIDRHLKSVLGNADAAGLSLVRETLNEPRDRWYGQLAVSSYASVTDGQELEAVLPVAAGVELLRGYVRLRNRLFVSLTNNHSHSQTLDPSSAILAGDYLYTAAFSSLHSMPDAPSSDCLEILPTIPVTITEAFSLTYTPAKSTEHDPAVFLDRTAGSLGEGAAVLGAALAGLDEPNHRYFTLFGRSLSTARQIDRVLDAAPSEALVTPPELDESQLRAHAERRRDEANQALDALSETIDVTRLRTFAETDADASNQDQTSSITNDDALD